MNEELKNQALEFARSYNVSVLATLEGNSPWARFMEHCRVDDDFSFWYATALSSNKVRQIKENQEVCVLVFHQGEDLRIFGKAKLYQDTQTRHKFWQEKWAEYFLQGKDDPEYAILKVEAVKVEYRNREKYGHQPLEVSFT